MKPLDGLDTDDALVLRLMGQHRRAGHIADRIDARHVGASIAIGCDDARASIFTPRASRPRFSLLPRTPTAEIMRSALMVLTALPSSTVAVTLSLPFSTAVTFAPVMILIPIFSKRLRASAAISASSNRQDLRQAPRPPCPRRPWCGRNRRIRYRWRPIPRRAGTWGRSWGPWPRNRSRSACRRAPSRARRAAERPWRRSCASPYRCLRSWRLSAPRWAARRAPSLWPLDQDFARGGELGLAPDHIDLVLLEQETDAVRQLRGDAARPRHDLADVEARLLVGQPVGIGMLHVMVDFSRPQQRLGRNAAPVEADAAKVLPIDHGGLEAELRRPDRRDVAARPRPDDDDVRRSQPYVVPRMGSECLPIVTPAPTAPLPSGRRGWRGEAGPIKENQSFTTSLPRRRENGGARQTSMAIGCSINDRKAESSSAPAHRRPPDGRSRASPT